MQRGRGSATDSMKESCAFLILLPVLEDKEVFEELQTNFPNMPKHRTVNAYNEHC